jgi:hypothetical protein
MNEIKKLLKKHKYLFTLSKKEDGTIVFHVPGRKQEPAFEAVDFRYTIGDNSVTMKIKKHESTIACPQYACRSFVLFDVNKICEELGYETNLLDFRSGNDSISEEAFFHAMWPAEIPLDDELRQKEHQLQQILIAAKRSLLPFDVRYEFEAQQAGVEHGYQVVRDYFFGE